MNQLIAIIQRDQASAIAIVNAALAPINEFHKGPGLRMAPPWLTFAIDSLAFDQEAQLATRHQMIRSSLALDVGQFDQEITQDNAQDYARVLDIIVTSASLTDWETSLPITHETVTSGLTTPPPLGSVKEVFIEAHRYSVVTLESRPTPMMRVTLPILFELEET